MAQAKSPKSTIHAAIPVKVSSGPISGSDAIVIHGPNKVGKSTLAGYLPSPFFHDIEKSTGLMNVARDEELFYSDKAKWPLLRGKIAGFAANPPPGVRTYVLDSATEVQRMIVDHVVETRQTESGKQVQSIEDFGWGKGWQFVFDEFDAMLADLDRIRARGIYVCMVCHSVSTPYANPAGENFLRFEPHLHVGDKQRRGSIRDRICQWADHILFLNFDVYVQSGTGKAAGGSSRQIATLPQAFHIAGSRSAQVVLPFDIQDPSAIWRTLGILPNAGQP